jgi:hypothetical protein
MPLAAWTGIGVTILLAILGGLVALFQRLRAMEAATAILSTSVAQLAVKSEPGWAAIVEQAKLAALHKPETKYERRDLLIKHRLAGSSTAHEDTELMGLFAEVIVDPDSSPVDRINSSAAIIAMKANDEDRMARLAMAALPVVPMMPAMPKVDPRSPTPSDL